MLVQRCIVCALGLVLTYLYQDEAREVFTEFISYCYDLFWATAIIKRSEHDNSARMVYAIKQELKKLAIKRVVVSDGAEYEPANGTYTINKFKIVVKDDKITIRKFLGQIHEIQDYLKTIYDHHCSSDKVTTFYVSNENKWNFPVFRRPRDISINSKNECVITDMIDFQGARKGYILEGAPGCGKSSIIEYVANKRSMSVYLVSLNSDKMNDSVLTNMIATIPPNSLIVFE